MIKHITFVFFAIVMKYYFLLNDMKTEQYLLSIIKTEISGLLLYNLIDMFKKYLEQGLKLIKYSRLCFIRFIFISGMKLSYSLLDTKKQCLEGIYNGICFLF